MKSYRQVVLAAAILCIAGTSGVFSQDLFSQAASANELRRADGLIWDTSVDDADPHWTFDGEFILVCRGAASCASAALPNVDFDLALTMVRPDGNESHSHQFSNFSATGVTVVNDDLIIDGTIDFLGGNASIIITIAQVSENATASIEIVGSGHIVGPISGVAVRSR